MRREARRIDEASIREARVKVSLAALVAKSVALKRRGRVLFGSCPFHAERTPSFVVREQTNTFQCYGCGARGDAIEWLVRVHRLTFLEAVAELVGGAALRLAPEEVERIASERREKAEEERRRHRGFAREMWAQRRPIAGSAGERYFRGRGITLPLPPTIAWAPSCPHGPREDRRWMPAVLLAVQDPAGLVGAVHRIYLDADSVLAGRPVKTRVYPDKALLGPVAGGAIRLGPAGRAMRTCEGPETGLSIVQAAPDRPLWVGIDAPHMRQIQWPEIVEELDVCGDADPVCQRPGAMFGKRPGSEAAWDTKWRFEASRKGRTARVFLPDGDKCDFNDLLQAP